MKPSAALALCWFSVWPARSARAEPPPREPGLSGSPLPPEPSPRRSLELSLQAGAAALRCGGGAPAAAEQLDPCAALGAPWGLGASLLWRLDGRWALGLGASRDGFGWAARGALGEGAGRGRWSALGLEARWYPRVEGAWEPQIGYRVGLGWLTMARADGSEALRREGASMAARAGAGRWLGARLRLDLGLEARWQATGEAEVCAAGVCLGSGAARLPDRSLGLVAAVTLAAGDEL